MNKDGKIDDFHYQSRYEESFGRCNFIEAKVWCPFCGSKVPVRMYEELDDYRVGNGIYEVLLSHRDPKHKDLNSSYANIRFPAIPKQTERTQLEFAKREENQRKNPHNNRHQP